MDIAESLAYVRAAACAVGLPLDEGTAQRVAEHMARTALMAQVLEQADLGPEDELAEVFRPAPFPKVDDAEHLA